MTEEQPATNMAIDYAIHMSNLEFENDTLKAFIIDMWNADRDDRFEILWDAHDYVKQLNKPK